MCNQKQMPGGSLWAQSPWSKAETKTKDVLTEGLEFPPSCPIPKQKGTPKICRCLWLKKNSKSLDLLDPSGNGLEHFQGFGWSQSHSTGLAHSLAPFLHLHCSLSPKQGSWFQEKCCPPSAWPLLQPDPVLTCPFPQQSLVFETCNA